MGIIKKLKSIFVKESPKVEYSIDDLEQPPFVCGPSHFSHGYSPYGILPQNRYTGVPAPVVLSHDPWFLDPPKSEMQMTHEEALGREEENSREENKEPNNIHEVMYDMSTKNGKINTYLNPIGGSENFQGGSENVFR